MALFMTPLYLSSDVEIIKVKAQGLGADTNQAIDKAIAEDSAVSRLYSKTLDKYLGSLSTRVRNISQPVFGRLRKFEFNTHKKTQDLINITEPFLAGINKLSGNQKNEVARQLYNGNCKEAQGLMPESLRSVFNDTIQPLLSETGDNLLETGHTFTKIEDYFPRLVKDIKGLEKSLGKTEKGVFEKAIRSYADNKGISVGKVTADELEEISLGVVLYNFEMKRGSHFVEEYARLFIESADFEDIAEAINYNLNR